MTYFDEHMTWRGDTSAFPAPPDHNYDDPPAPDDALMERISAAQKEGRWADSLALKASAAWPTVQPRTEPSAVESESAERPAADDGSRSDEWPAAIEDGEAAWRRKADFFDPQSITAPIDADNQDDDINDGEDDR